MIVGNSMGAGHAALAAAQHPQLVAPCARRPVRSQRGDEHAAACAPAGGDGSALGSSTWRSYMPKLYAGHRPEDFEEHRDRVVASMRRPGTPRRSRSRHGPTTPRAGATGRRQRADPGHDGRSGPRLPGPARRGGLDREDLDAEVVDDSRSRVTIPSLSSPISRPRRSFASSRPWTPLSPNGASAGDHRADQPGRYIRAERDGNGRSASVAAPRGRGPPRRCPDRLCDYTTALVAGAAWSAPTWL